MLSEELKQLIGHSSNHETTFELLGLVHYYQKQNEKARRKPVGSEDLSEPLERVKEKARRKYQNEAAVRILERRFKSMAITEKPLSQKPKLINIQDVISGVIKTKKTKWNLPIFDDCKTDEEWMNKMITEKVEVQEGVYTCKKCGCKRILTGQMQTRSGDEQITTFCKCTECGKDWRM